MASLKQSDIELWVQSALIAQEQGVGEDDLVELKGGWKDPVLAARQLAGSANRSAGEHILWIFGMDPAGTMFDLSGYDAANWCTQVTARFDQEAPELLAHRRVQTGENTFVYAMVFATDAAPYVVKSTKPDDDRLEIPIRTGTGTRSANRGQIMRMLAPAIRVPQLTVLEAFVVASRPKDGGPFELHGRVATFLDYPANRDAVTLPAHLREVTFRIDASGEEWPLTLSVSDASEGMDQVRELFSRRPPAQRTYNPVGVNLVDGGLTLTGPGAVCQGPLVSARRRS